MIRTFIVDDEPLARARMRHLLASFEDIHILGEKANGAECIEGTLTEQPDLLFLDIRMPDYTGLEVVSELIEEMEELPLIVFATAYNEHAIAAFDLNAIDYLLKPVSADRLAKTIERVRKTLASQTTAKEGEKLRTWSREQKAEPNAEYPARLEIRDRGMTTFVPVKEIHLLRAEGNYIEVFFGSRTQLMRMTMARLECLIDPAQFVRISRSSMVAVDRVQSVERAGRNDYWVHLNTGDRIAASRNLDDLEQRLRDTPQPPV